MKISIKPANQPAFAPRSLTLTFETQKELDAFGTLFNNTVVLDAVKKVFHVSLFDDIASEAKSLGAEIHDEISNLSSALRTVR